MKRVVRRVTVSHLHIAVSQRKNCEMKEKIKRMVEQVVEEISKMNHDAMEQAIFSLPFTINPDNNDYRQTYGIPAATSIVCSSAFTAVQ